MTSDTSRVAGGRRGLVLTGDPVPASGRGSWNGSVMRCTVRDH